MCTVVVASKVIPDHPLVVVANRDEELDRPATPPFVWHQNGRAFLAPRDDRAGGTWLGLNEDRVFVGITNRFRGPNDRSRRSRGELVLRALGGASARAIHADLASVDPRRYNGFHLVYADASDVLVTISDGSTLAQLTLGAGLHVVTERSFGGQDEERAKRATSRDSGQDAPRRRRILAAWARLVSVPFVVEPLTRLLAEHDPSDLLGSTCIHIPELRYGTRSGMVLVADETRESLEMLWAEGPPCTTAFTDVDVHGIAKTR